MKALLILAGLITALAIATTASASPPTHSGSISLSPPQPSVGNPLVISGCGYPANEVRFEVVISGPTGSFAYSPFTWPGTDASGCFSTAFAPYVLPSAGAYYVQAFGAKQPSTNSSLGFTVAP